MTTETTNTPKQAKGGAFASADIPLIKKVLLAVLSESNEKLTVEEERQAAHLLHRLGRIS
jgi:hypothetical protein